MPTMQEWSERSSTDIKARIVKVTGRPGNNTKELKRLGHALAAALYRERQGGSNNIERVAVVASNDAREFMSSVYAQRGRDGNN